MGWSSYGHPVEPVQDNKERDELLAQIEPNLPRLGEIEQGIVAKIKESEECNSSGLLYLKCVRNHLAKSEEQVETEVETETPA